MTTGYDVIVVGAGTAGIPAALGAAERGLSVALVEAGSDIGGTLVLSNASISAAGTSIQREHGIDDTPEAHFRDALRINHGTGDHVLLRAWVDEAAATIEWLRAIGWTCTPDEPAFAPEHDLYDTPRTYRTTRGGFGVLDPYRAELDRVRSPAKLVTMLDTRMTGLVMRDGSVTGITAVQGGREVTLGARAVILTTGGFCGNAQHWQAFHDFVPLRYHVDTVMGDAIDVVRKVGGATWFEDYCRPAFGGVRNLGSPAAAWFDSVILPSRRPPWEIYVNERGERFMAEDEPSIDQRERAAMAQPNWAFWVVYDEAIRRTAPPLFLWKDGELDRRFAAGDEDFVKADTLAALADRTGMPAAALAQTVDRYNRGQAVGSDMYRREYLPAPIGEGPFYAVRHYGCSISCHPGIRVDDGLRVVRQDGTVIEGLYGAGEVIGVGFLGHGFLSGSVVSSAITFGRRLGREVLA